MKSRAYSWEAAMIANDERRAQAAMAAAKRYKENGGIRHVSASSRKASNGNRTESK